MTIFVSTHFMNEAERCDRISLMHAGRVLATGHAGRADRGAQGAATLEEAFIGYLEEAGRRRDGAAPSRRRRRVDRAGPSRAPAAAVARRPFSLRAPARLSRSARRSSCWRDPIRLGFALLGTAFLMLVFGFGITIDVEHLTFAVARPRPDTTRAAPISRSFAARATSPRSRRSPTTPSSSGGCGPASSALAIEIPPGFGRDLKRGRRR